MDQVLAEHERFAQAASSPARPNTPKHAAGARSLTVCRPTMLTAAGDERCREQKVNIFWSYRTTGAIMLKIRINGFGVSRLA
jgi:hypothetical protein